MGSYSVTTYRRYGESTKRRCETNKQLNLEIPDQQVSQRRNTMGTGASRFTPIESETFRSAPSDKGYPSTVVKLLELLSDLRSEFDKLEVGQPVQLTHDCYPFDYNLPKFSKKNGCEIHKLYQMLNGKYAPDETYTLTWRHPKGKGLPKPSESLVYITKMLRITSDS